MVCSTLERFCCGTSRDHVCRTSWQIADDVIASHSAAHACRAQVDVYSFSMILYQLFEHTPPFAGVDPVEAARQAALYDKRPNLMQLGEQKPFPMGVGAKLVSRSGCMP